MHNWYDFRRAQLELDPYRQFALDHFRVLQIFRIQRRAVRQQCRSDDQCVGGGQRVTLSRQQRAVVRVKRYLFHRKGSRY